MLVMISKTQIHSSFNTIIIYLYIHIILLLGHCQNASEWAWNVFWAICNDFCFPSFLASCVLESASHSSMLRMDAASWCILARYVPCYVFTPRACPCSITGCVIAHFTFTKYHVLFDIDYTAVTFPNTVSARQKSLELCCSSDYNAGLCFLSNLSDHQRLVGILEILG